jgi:hypothetical protein
LLVTRLRLPPYIKGNNGIKEPSREALCMLLARLAHPKRLADLHLEFGWKPERTSRIAKESRRFIYKRWKHLLHFDAERLTPRKLREYSNVINAKGVPLRNCWGFVDGTVRPIARPTKKQRTTFNGHKRTHALKYHAVVTPDGIIAHLFGPVEGRRHDKYLWNESKIMDQLTEHAFDEEGQPMQIYGDPAYGLNRHLISPYQGARVNDRQRLFNKRMSRVRIVVEWVFKEITQQFAYLSWKREQKVFQKALGEEYAVGVLLHNAHVCLHRPQIPQFFERENGHVVRPFDDGALFHPPSLEEYFHG